MALGWAPRLLLAGRQMGLGSRLGLACGLGLGSRLGLGLAVGYLCQRVSPPAGSSMSA